MITTVTGDNDYLIGKHLSGEKNKYIEKFGEFSVEQIDCEETEPERITEALQSLPFLVTNKLVILLSPSRNKKLTDNFEAIIATVPDEVEVIIVESKLDKRSSFYKTLRAKTDYKEYKGLDLQGLSAWLVSEAKVSEGSISSADARYLVERVGLNQLRLDNELKKLLIHNPQITKQDIDDLTTKSPQSSVFDLIDAAVSGNAEQALDLYEEQRQQKVEPIQIIAMLAWQLHILALIKTAGERSTQQIASEAKINPYVLTKSQRLAKNLSQQEVRKFIEDLYRLDIMLKTRSVDTDQALHGYIMSLKKIKPRRVWRGRAYD